MKVPLLVTRAGIVAFKLAILIIVILSIVPLIDGGIGLDFEDEGQSMNSYENDVFSFEFPVTVSNNGFYDINDLEVTFALLDDHGDVVTQSTSGKIDIPAGGDTDVMISMSVDLNDVRDSIGMEMVFNGTDLTVDLGLSAKYTWDLVRASVEADMDFELGPFVYNIDVRTDQANVWYDGSYRLMVPYSFNCDDMVTGQQIQVTTVFSDANGTIGTSTQDVELQSYNDLQAEVTISNEAYQRLMLGEEVTASTTVTFLDVSTTSTRTFYYGGGYP